MNIPAAPRLTLADGMDIPRLGFGVFRVPNAVAAQVVGAALSAGYRAVDTASYYRNESGTGEAIAASGLPRQDLHITTKLWHTDLGYESTLRACQLSLKNLNLDYLDLYLIHWPVPSRDLYLQSWRALERLQRDGLVRSVGVSNFHQPQLERLLAETDTRPVVNQIEMHPRLAQADLRAFHSRHHITTQAWSPLGHGTLLDNPTIELIAERHERTPAQVLLRWNLELGCLAVSKSVTPKRMASNLRVLDFHLSAADHAAIATLNDGSRTGPDPEIYGR